MFDLAVIPGNRPVGRSCARPRFADRLDGKRVASSTDECLPTSLLCCAVVPGLEVPRHAKKCLYVNLGVGECSGEKRKNHELVAQNHSDDSP
jgi:hypothetical protein